MLDTRFTRFVGDIGNPQSYAESVLFEVVRGATVDKVVPAKAPPLIEDFVAAGERLIARGANAITTGCGFLVLNQQNLAARLRVPVATSALLQVPMVARMLPKGKRPAILTFSAESLTVHHLAAVGIDPQTPVVGMPLSSEFQRSIREGDTSVPFEVLKNEVLGVARQMVESDPSIGAIVCECTNITPYSHDLKREFGMPVFDMVTLVHWFHRALRPQHFPQG
jgi:hypothetical protein